MYEKVRSRIRKSEASSTTKVKLRVRARSTARTLIYCFLLKQYRGVTIENRRAAKRTATRSALLYGHVFAAYKIRNLSCCRSSAIMK